MKTQDLIGSLEDIFTGISKILLNYDLNVKNFENRLRHQLVSFASTQTDEDGKKFSDSKINQLTGITREQISKLRKVKKTTYKQDRLATLLTELWKNSDDEKVIPLKGKISFYSLAASTINSSYSPEIAFKKLIELEAISVHPDGVKVLTNYLNVSNDVGKSFSELGMTALWLIETVLSNIRIDEKDEKLYQNSFYSTQVPPKNIPSLHAEILEYLRSVYSQIKVIIEKYEVDVPLDSFDVYGVSMLEFSKFINKNHKV